MTEKHFQPSCSSSCSLACFVPGVSLATYLHIVRSDHTLMMMMMSRMTPVHAGQPLPGVCNCGGVYLSKPVYAVLMLVVPMKCSQATGQVTSHHASAIEHGSTHMSAAKQSDVQSGTELDTNGSNLQQPELNCTTGYAHTECTNARGHGCIERSQAYAGPEGCMGVQQRVSRQTD